VTPFQGALLGPDEVMANTEFEVAWNGPNGSGDFVTITKADAAQGSYLSYFYTTAGSPGTLLAPLDPGAYELRYVLGQDNSIQARRPITVIAAVVTLDAPDEVARGAAFQVTWTGPDASGDYITIVPAGSAPGTYLSYAYTYVGNPGELTAPDSAGNYEIWYVPGQNTQKVLLSIPIRVK
jgi:Ca-activated chloride channel family protein